MREKGKIPSTEWSSEEASILSLLMRPQSLKSLRGVCGDSGILTDIVSKCHFNEKAGWGDREIKSKGEEGIMEINERHCSEIHSCFKKTHTPPSKP